MSLINFVPATVYKPIKFNVCYFGFHYSMQAEDPLLLLLLLLLLIWVNVGFTEVVPIAEDPGESFLIKKLPQGCRKERAIVRTRASPLLLFHGV